MLERHSVQTSVLYPAIQEFSAFAGVSRGTAPRSEAVARRQVTIPLFPHLDDAEQDRVVSALGESLATLRSG